MSAPKLKPSDRPLAALAIIACTMALMWLLAVPCANYLRLPGDLWGSAASLFLASLLGLIGLFTAARVYAGTQPSTETTNSALRDSTPR